MFLTGAAYDPSDKPGAANLTASLLTGGGTRELTYKQVVDAMFPMATAVSSQVDKEMVVFYGSTDVHNLEKYYALFRGLLLTPGWREDDLRRVKDQTINYIRESLRNSNEEELAKEALYMAIFNGRPYGHTNAGTVSALQQMGVGDLRRFYQTHFTQTNLIHRNRRRLPRRFPGSYEEGFRSPAERSPGRSPKGEPKSPGVMQALLIEKPTRSVAISLGTTLDVKRGDPDFPALLVAQSYFGQHRASGGRLFDRMRDCCAASTTATTPTSKYFPPRHVPFRP